MADVQMEVERGLREIVVIFPKFNSYDFGYYLCNSNYTRTEINLKIDKISN